MLPHWWIPNKHDRILLMFALKFGTDVRKYAEELDGPGCNKYEKFMGTTYKLFELFVKQDCNVLNRLRYITYILRHYIIAPHSQDDQKKDFLRPTYPISPGGKFTQLVIDSPDNKGKTGSRFKKKRKRAGFEKNRINLVFLSDYQAAIHIGSNMGQSEMETKKISLGDVTSWRDCQTISFSRTSLSRIPPTHDSSHRTIVRNIHREFQDVLQLYDLVHFGPILTKHLVRQLKFKQRKALYVAIGIVLREIPTIIAIDLLQEYQQELRHGEPEIIYWICLQILQLSTFPQCTALILAHYLSVNRDIDLARSDEWGEFSLKMQILHQIH